MFFLLLLGLFLLVSGHGGEDHSSHGYRFNKPIDFECLSRNGSVWTGDAAPKCVETNKAISPKFGVDGSFMCLMTFTDKDVDWLIDLIERRTEWRCRARMIPGHDQFYVPFSIPIWGVVEGTHIHVNSHLNFVFHAYQGSLMAVAAYPLRDQFHFLDKKGGSFPLHGHVKFFNGETFSNLNSRAFSPFDTGAMKESTNYVLTIVIWSALSFLLTFCGFLAFFYFRLKPDLIAKTLREKGSKAD